MAIDDKEFGGLCEGVKNLVKWTEKMDEKQDIQHDKITALENHNLNVKRGFKWIVAGIIAAFSLLKWIISLD